ncbi:MAG: DUF839 domain-containing protein [Lentisphaerae bacterium]|nr:MAG: DUF839 domain-containing protein [Lentisphaerota bacterium]
MRFNKKVMAVVIASASVLAACNGDDGKDGEDLTAVPKLTRIATIPLGAEVTGIFKTDNGDLFFNVQHPDDSLPEPDNQAAIGAWVGVDFDQLDPRLEDVSVPSSNSDEAKTVQLAAGSYQVIARMDDTIHGYLPNGVGAILTADGSTVIKQSQDPDLNVFVPVSADGSSGYLFTVLEDRPGSAVRIGLSKMGDGTWNANDAINVDFSSVKGTIINCFGSLSPWGTPLLSEENYEAENAENWNNPEYTSGYPNYADVKNIQTYLGGEFPNPYNYGYIVELKDPDGTPLPVKHFTLGRVAHENAVVMPDMKTVYMTDDGTNKGFYKFVADNAADLSVGTLYAAKVQQDATKDVARAGFNITWVKLGHASNAEIAAWIAEYDNIDESDYVAGQTSYISDEEITEWATNGVGDDRYAFLETLRAAKAKGATTEFRKMEGIAINYAGVANGSVPYMYAAMSAVEKGMSDDEGDIQLETNKCGAVYRFGITSDYDVLRMDPAVVGGAYDGDAENRCSTDAIANPDNIAVLNDGRVLIGEDTSKHVNNMIWVYNPEGE